MNDELEKKYYELGFLVREENFTPIKSILLKHGAGLLTEGQLVKVSLTYPIKKQAQPFFGYFRFELEPLTTFELEKELKLEPSLLRHILIKLPAAVIRDSTQPQPLQPSLQPIIKRKEVKTPAPILTNEALEKKIEEILQ